MRNDKSKILAIFLVLLTIVVVASSILLKKKSDDSEKITLLNNPSKFFTVNSCLYRFTSYISKKDTENLINTLDEDYKKRENIDSSNVLSKLLEVPNNATFISKKMYYSELNSNITKYYVYGIMQENIIHDYTYVDKRKDQEVYFIVNLDSSTKTFTIEPYDGKIFMDGEKNEE